MLETKRVEELVRYLVDQAERAQAEWVIHDDPHRPGFDPKWPHRGTLEELSAARDRTRKPEVLQPAWMPSREELEAATLTTQSIIVARILAPVQVAGAERVREVVDAYADARYQAIRTAWTLPLVALALGATGGAVGSALAPELPAALVGSTEAAVGTAGVAVETIAPVYDVAAATGWLGIDAATSLVAPEEPGVKFTKSAMISALLGMRGRLATAATFFLIEEFIRGFLGLRGDDAR